MPFTSEEAVAFISWLEGQAIAAARGDDEHELDVDPSGRFWLGRLAPEATVATSPLGERAERIDPCAVGIRLRPRHLDERPATYRAAARAWRETEQGVWRKSPLVAIEGEIGTPASLEGAVAGGGRESGEAFSEAGCGGLSMEIRSELELGKGGLDLVFTVVNTSPDEIEGVDTNLYEVSLEIEFAGSEAFVLDDLKESFRYGRTVPAYGVNCGVQIDAPNRFSTTDSGNYELLRPVYWDEESLGPMPDFSFQTLATEPDPPLQALTQTLRAWGAANWGAARLRERRASEGWSDEMLRYALEEADRFEEEVQRIAAGVELLRQDEVLRRAFMLSNRAFDECPAIRHTEWRAFQLGFVLANLSALSSDAREEESEVVDTVWFATGGGKTETYLLFVLTAAFADRLRGKTHGVTSWARFPLRMLSLQQTQRFADVLAAAEMVRRRERIRGARFEVGFFVGMGGTPNRVKSNPRPGEIGPDEDPETYARFRVLIDCPFCGSDDLEVSFQRQRWALEHFCRAAACPWEGRPLPFRVVDEEIFRFLPTVVIGTLDKAALLAIQAAMRGLYAAPYGICPRSGHGFTYAPRRATPNGCLYPGCDAASEALPQAAENFPPSIRMQDELHLLRDSLGAVDSHYEALLDALQRSAGSNAKVIASSATLAGHDDQVGALYRRRGRVFPLAGPHAGASFWTRRSDELARRYVAIAPRGLTLDFARDRLIESLQRLIRWAHDNQDDLSSSLGIRRSVMDDLILTYGVHVVYGSTLKDVEATARSFESEIDVQPLTARSLTGRTPLDDVRATLQRLKEPEATLDERIHLIAASSMLSHGVDIDRLNVMAMLGLPLATAEFIQTTARIGRRHPGLVFVFHKIARERDAAIYRMFPTFVEHSDRLIDPIPITAKSRRVLELTFPGLTQARIYATHEPAALAASLRPLTLPGRLSRAFTNLGIQEEDELEALIRMLAIEGPLDERLRQDLATYVREFFRALNDPTTSAEWVSDLFPTGPPMRSLRDVEAQVPVYSSRRRA